jgi:hypothetical protein
MIGYKLALVLAEAQCLYNVPSFGAVLCKVALVLN